MKKPTFLRLALGMVQHILAAVVVLLVVFIFSNTRIKLDSVNDGAHYYSLDLFEGAERFEDTNTFEQMVSNAVNDLVVLAVVRDQMETDGKFDSGKQISCTDFVNRKARVSDCPVTANYKLDDLIKWGRSGVEMTEWSFTKKDFVQYFDSTILRINNFYLDEDNQMKFRGFGEEVQKTDGLSEITDDGELIKDVKTGYGFFDETYYMYSSGNADSLVDIVYDYLAEHMDKELTLVYEDGTEKVYLQVLKSKYVTADGDGQLSGMVDNWVDYASLENNVITTIEDITYNYNQYQNRIEKYQEGNSNLQYLIRTGAGAGRKVFTNLSSGFDTRDEELVNNYFSGLGKYFKYSLGEMSLEGNLNLGEKEIFNYISAYEYAYSSDTEIWVGIDTSYPVHDQFTLVKEAYSRVVPHIWKYLLVIIIGVLLWLILWNYLFFTAGRAVDQNGLEIHYLNWFDRLFTEFILLLGLVFVYMGLWGYAVLRSYIEFAYLRSGAGNLLESDSYQWYIYGFGALYGFMASLTFSFMWYSLIRRIRGKNLWRNSLLHWIFGKLKIGVSMVLCHRNTAVRTLIPYNLFLLVNLLGLFFLYILRYHTLMAVLDIAALLAFDALTGVLLFRRNAEMAEIVEGINRIRQGEVDYQLDSGRLHGENRGMAEAVNNIGEGIRKAVETSMKDERMKTDLITNVSHDIKTPLTSIINYVDLLKRERIETEPAKSYIEILETKSQRLKQLTDDLVEVSRISSGNIILINEKLNLTELVNQSLGEFSERFEEKELQAVFNEPEKPAYIYADSRRMWRVMENLFNNICKYAMPRTRVYLDMQAVNSLIELSIKNISEQQLNISPEELTERFIRGDSSRTTEGSGLGLSITQNLVTVQGGRFRILLDGDLFKVIIRFPEYRDSPEARLEEGRSDGKEASSDSGTPEHRKLLPDSDVNVKEETPEDCLSQRLLEQGPCLRLNPPEVLEKIEAEASEGTEIAGRF